MIRRHRRDAVDLQAMGDLITAYCRRADANDVAGLVSLFTPGCRVDLGGGPIVGRAALREFVEANLSRHCSATSHLTGAPLIEMSGPDAATSTVAVHAWHRFVGGADGELWGEYHDVLVRHEGRWSLDERTLLVAGQRGLDGMTWRSLPRRAGP